MARKRLLSPEFFTDAKLLRLSPLIRLFFQGLWCHADKVGVLRDDPLDLHVRILPRDEFDANAALDRLADDGLLVRYQHGEFRFLWIRNFTRYQRAHVREQASGYEIPSESSRIIRGSLIGCAEPAKGRASPQKVAGGGYGGGGGYGCGEEATDCGQFALQIAAPPSPPKKRIKKINKGTDPRHTPLVECLCDAFKALRGAEYPFTSRDAKSVTDLLALGQPEAILGIWQRALRSTKYPSVSTMPELVRHWPHFAGNGQPSSAGINAEDIDWTRPRDPAQDPF